MVVFLDIYYMRMPTVEPKQAGTVLLTEWRTGAGHLDKTPFDYKYLSPQHLGISVLIASYLYRRIWGNVGFLFTQWLSHSLQWIILGETAHIVLDQLRQLETNPQKLPQQLSRSLELIWEHEFFICIPKSDWMQHGVTSLYDYTFLSILTILLCSCIHV